MPHRQVQKAVAGIFRVEVKTRLPSAVCPLWEDPDKEEILASMPEFSQ